MVHDKLQELFRTVFNDDELTLSDDMTSADIDGWDSVATINLMFSVEQAFGVQFAGDEFSRFASVGDLRRWLESRCGRSAA